MLCLELANTGTLYAMPGVANTGTLYAMPGVANIGSPYIGLINISKWKYKKTKTVYILYIFIY